MIIWSFEVFACQKLGLELGISDFSIFLRLEPIAVLLTQSALLLNWSTSQWHIHCYCIYILLPWSRTSGPLLKPRILQTHTRNFCLQYDLLELLTTSQGFGWTIHYYLWRDLSKHKAGPVMQSLNTLGEVYSIHRHNLRNSHWHSPTCNSPLREKALHTNSSTCKATRGRLLPLRLFSCIGGWQMCLSGSQRRNRTSLRMRRHADSHLLLFSSWLPRLCTGPWAAEHRLLG